MEKTVYFTTGILKLDKATPSHQKKTGHFCTKLIKGALIAETSIGSINAIFTRIRLVWLLLFRCPMGDSTKRPLPTGFIVPKQHTERLLIERLQNSKTDEDYFRWLMFVVAFYRGIEKTESARALLQLFLETSENSDQKAHCHLALGQIATDEQRFESAMYHFAAALALNPSQPKVTYVLHNNIGYCHNQLGRYKDAERH